MSDTAVTLRRPSSRVRLRRGLSKAAWNVAPFITLVVVWQAISTLRLVPRVWLPPPTGVLTALEDLVSSGQYFGAIGASLLRLMTGFIVSAIVGVALGMAMGIRRGLADALMPLVSFMSAISGIIWVPLAILWFGLGPMTINFIVWNSIVWVVLFNTLVGVRSVPKIYESALLTMGGRRLRVIRDVLIPGALPNIVTGFRLGMGFGWRGLIAAEIFAASSGLGFLIFNASYYLKTDVVISALITIGVVWLATDRLLLAPLEKLTIRRWGVTNE